MPHERIVLVASFRRQVTDFLEIAHRSAPLDVRVIHRREIGTLEPDDIAVSVTPLKACRAGTVYCGQRMGKLAELQALEAGGVRVPRSAKVEPGLYLDPALWGGGVIVKPMHGYQSRGLRMVPLDQVKDFAGHVVQQYVPTGERANKIRMLTFFGRPLYSVRVANPQAGSLVTSCRGRTWTAEITPELREIAAACYAAIPQVPAQAVDVVTDINSGLSYVLEVNARGRIWHLSTAHGRNLQASTRFNLYTQLDALGQAALALQERFG